MNLRAILLLLVAATTLLTCISAHPVCAINDPNEELRFPTVPQQPLSFCNTFNNWPGSCCNKDTELTDARDPLQALVNLASYPACYNQLKSVYCSWCDPWAGHIYGSEETSTATPYPMLCNAYCNRMFDACADVPLNQAYARRIGGIPAGTGTVKLRDFFATSFDYCNVYSTNSTLYCLTDNPSEVKQPDLMMPATTYPVEPAFPNLNLNDPALLTDPNWRNHLVQVLPVPGSNYLAAVLQHGIVVIFDNNYEVNTYQIFFDIRGRTSYSEPTENGVHGIAFHPEFATNGHIYVKWNDGPNDLVISRFTADAAKTTVLVNTELNMFRFPKSSLIHNGGSPIFGEDGYLYIPVGDGISFTENFVPYNTAPDMTKHNGKVLRIDVNNVPQGAAYGIPQDNPFINIPGALPEIYAYGLRNPWTLVYDAPTNLWFIGDVGQATWEEINVLYKGKNYGWHKKEAFNCYYPGESDCLVENEVEPIFAYPHEEALCERKPCAFGTAVIVGGVYRGDRVPSLRGQLIFSDFEKTSTYAMQFNPANPKENVVYRLNLEGQDFPINIAGFGHDHDNNMFILNWYQANIMRFKQETVKPPSTIPPVDFPTEPIVDVSPTSATPIADTPETTVTPSPVISTPTSNNNQASLATRDKFDPRILGLAAAATLFYFA